MRQGPWRRISTGVVAIATATSLAAATLDTVCSRHGAFATSTAAHHEHHQDAKSIGAHDSHDHGAPEHAPNGGGQSDQERCAFPNGCPTAAPAELTGRIDGPQSASLVAVSVALPAHETPRPMRAPHVLPFADGPPASL